MTYKLIEEYSSDFTGPAMTPKGIAIHWWGDPAQKPTFDGILNVLLTRGQQRSASVNFMAEDGLVACLVSSDTVAWGQGDGGSGWGNLNCISIECNPRCTAGDRETVAELIADMRLLWGDLPLYPHNKFTATQCPGVWEQYLPWLDVRANQILAAKRGQTAPAPVEQLAPASSPVPSGREPGPGEFRVDPGDTLSGIAAQFGETLQGLIAANPGINPDLIFPGQILNHSMPAAPGLPPYCTVDPGDTLSGIAVQYGVSLDYILSRNPGINADLIFPGQRINL